ncbi:hypothetical protein C5167_016002 [Papaver somniferum]|nr:hypothetical protein C5167_016002 [Papaver somniferum]
MHNIWYGNWTGNAPMYIAETAPSQVRGRLISLKELFIVLGMLLGYTVGGLKIDIVAGWRYVYATSIHVSLLMRFGVWWLPPLPRWLLCAIEGKGNTKEARETAICCSRQMMGGAIGDSAPEQVYEMLESTYRWCWIGFVPEGMVGNELQLDWHQLVYKKNLLGWYAYGHAVAVTDRFV